MATLSFQWTGDGIARMNIALEKVSGPRKVKAYQRALNHTGAKVYTAVKRAVSKQMGVPQRKAAERLRKHSAHGGALEYRITSSGRAFRLKEIKHRVLKSRGVTAYPWGEKKSFPHAFVIDRYGGHIFQRKGKARFPVFALFGPNINKQLVKNESAAAFQRVVATSLPPRIEHEIKVMTNGVLS